MRTVTGVDCPIADTEAGRVIVGVAENANSNAAARTHIKMKRVKRIRTAMT
jgi:hypothetical protein